MWNFNFLWDNWIFVLQEGVTHKVLIILGHIFSILSSRTAQQWKIPSYRFLEPEATNLKRSVLWVHFKENIVKFHVARLSFHRNGKLTYIKSKGKVKWLEYFHLRKVYPLFKYLYKVEVKNNWNEFKTKRKGVKKNWTIKNQWFYDFLGRLLIRLSLIERKVNPFCLCQLLFFTIVINPTTFLTVINEKWLNDKGTGKLTKGSSSSQV